MAALDFPNAPTLNQQYAAPNGATYLWDGAAWITTGSPAGVWTDTGTALTPTTSTRTLSIPATNNQVVLGGPTIQGKVSQDTSPTLSILTNDPYAPQDATKASWALQLSTSSDLFQVLRRAPNAASGATTQLLAVDNAGNMTLTRYGACATLTGALSIPNNTTTAVSFDGTTVNRSAAWVSGTPDRVFLPQTGVYLLFGQVLWAGNTTGTRAITLVNKAGTNLTTAQIGANAFALATNTTFLYASTDPTDYIRLTCYQNSGAALGGGGPPHAVLVAWRLSP